MATVAELVAPRLRVNLVDPAEQKKLANRVRKRDNQRRLRAADPEHALTLSRAWCAANPEASRDRSQRYNDRHRESRRRASREYARRLRSDPARAEALKQRNAEWRQSDRARAWYEENRERIALNARKSKLWTKYGLTLEDYAQLWEDSGSSCPLCLRAFSDSNKAHVDHSHDTERVRGLLCGPCNRGVGLLRDSSEVLDRAAAYLRNGGA